MRQFLLILLTFFAMPHSLYGACLATLNQTVSASSPENMAFFNSGGCLGVVNTTPGGSNNLITSYSFSNCTISSPSTVSSPGASFIAVSSTNCVASTNFNSVVYYTKSGCTLMEAGTASTGTNISSLAFSPNGTCAVGTNQSSQTLSNYSVSGCTLLELGQFSTAPNTPINIAFSPFTCNGHVFFAVLYNNSNTVGLFSISGSLCTIASIGSITTMGSGGHAIAFSPVLCNGNILLAVDIANQGLQLFSINPSNCDVASVDFINLSGTYASSTGFAFTPDGSCLISNDQFATETPTSTTNIYSVNSTTCTLTNTSSLEFLDDTTQGIAISPSGTCMAISFPVTGAIRLYTITTIIPVVTVNVSPAIQVVCPGQSLIFTATVTGTGPFTYVWTGPNGFSESTGNNPTLTIAHPTAANIGSYSVTVNGSTPSSTVEAVVKSVSC